MAQTFPPVPAEVPLIVRAPEDADKQAWAAVDALRARYVQINDLMGVRKWEEAAPLIASLPDVQWKIEQARQVVLHGDLNVDELVMRKLADGEWHDYSMDSQLGKWDWRLRTRMFQDPRSTYVNGISPVEAVIQRLHAEGKLKKHGGRHAFRLKKAGEK